MAAAALCRAGGGGTDRLLVALYLGLTTAALASAVLPPLAALAAHGKTRRRGEGTGKDATRVEGPAPSARAARLWHRLIADLVVPKTWFLHFYAVGLAALLLAGAIAARSEVEPVEFTDALAVLLLALHLARRLYECLYTHRWSPDSRMHLLAYGLGLLHYLVLPLVFVKVVADFPLPGCDHDEHRSTRTEAATATAVTSWLWLGACAGLNIWAQYQQHRHHVLLVEWRVRQEPATAQQRPRRGGSAPSPAPLDYRRGPPTQGWFRAVCCPHYTAEVVLYAALAALRPTPAGAALLLWVAANLAVSARAQHRWYRQHVPGYAARHLRAIFPALL